MKNMKRLISIIAVLAMMLSMATVASAVAISGSETFLATISGAEVLEGSTDDIVLRVSFDVQSSANAVNGVSQYNVNLTYDQNVLEYVSIEASSDLNPSSLVDPASTQYDGSNGVLMLKYQNTTKSADYKITSASYFDITFKLADGAKAGDSTSFTAAGNAGVNSINASLATNMSWISKANVGNYFSSGTVTVKSATPPAPLDPVVTPDSGEAGEAGTTVVWGTAANVVASENGTDEQGNTIYSYTSEGGSAVEFGVQITDGEFAGFYPALGLKEGKFAIKFIGDAASDLATQIYLKIGGVLQD
jgi:hypothetical protein